MVCREKDKEGGDRLLGILNSIRGLDYVVRIGESSEGCMFLKDHAGRWRLDWRKDGQEWRWGPAKRTLQWFRTEVMLALTRTMGVEVREAGGWMGDGMDGWMGG